MVGTEGLAVDKESGTIRPLVIPRHVTLWSGDAADALCGVDSYECVVYVLGPDATFAQHPLSCGQRRLQIPFVDEPARSTWFDADHMAVAEMWGGDVVAAHASSDGGDTWWRIPSPGAGEDADQDVADVLATLE